VDQSFFERTRGAEEPLLKIYWDNLGGCRTSKQSSKTKEEKTSKGTRTKSYRAWEHIHSGHKKETKKIKAITQDALTMTEFLESIFFFALHRSCLKRTLKPSKLWKQLTEAPLNITSFLVIQMLQHISTITSMKKLTFSWIFRLCILWEASG